MKIFKTKFKDLYIIKDQIYKDKRGFLKQIFKKKILNKNFIFTICSMSKKNVVRGLHIQLKKAQGKYVSVLNGKIFDVALDLRKKSKTFGKFFSIILDSNYNTSIYIPEGFAHGFMSLTNNTIVNYTNTRYRESKFERGILYNDKKLNIKWPKGKKIISKRDGLNLSFDDFLKINPY